MDYIHNKKNVVLRDFKDDNVIIRRVFDPNNPSKSTHIIKLIDFGLAK